MIGWRKSWLTDARKRDFASLASSAACLAARRSCSISLRAVISSLNRMMPPIRPGALDYIAPDARTGRCSPLAHVTAPPRPMTDARPRGN